MTQDAITIVRAWHQAVNDGDIGQLASLVSDDVEVGGPRGSAHGRDVLIDWVGRSGIRMEPIDWYQRVETIVVSQQATWPGEDGTSGEPRPVATAFVVRDDRIVSIIRHPDQAAAFAAAGLAESDRVVV